MKDRTKILPLVLALAMCLSLTACGVFVDNPFFPDDDIGGDDWRVTGVSRDGGTITRDGEDTFVLVCIHKTDATFYYDEQDQTLFDYVEYPVTIMGDPWEAFQGTDFDDLNGDGNSDVTIQFNDGGYALLMVWYWDAESGQFMFQPEESQLGDYGEENGAWVLTAGELPFANVEALQAQTNEDGTYYCADMAEDGLIKVVNTAQPRDFSAEDTEAYLTDCALALGEADADRLVSVEKSDVYTLQMTFPVYLVTYTAGENEDTREWTVFAMETDLYTYLYGFSVAIDSADELRPACEDVFASLNLSKPA